MPIEREMPAGKYGASTSSLGSRYDVRCSRHPALAIRIIIISDGGGSVSFDP